jgi:hypothetical protein
MSRVETSFREYVKRIGLDKQVVKGLIDRDAGGALTLTDRQFLAARTQARCR